MKRSVLALVCSGVVIALASVGFAAPVHFEHYGFTIEELVGEAADDVTHQVLSMFLPTTDAFAPNINIQIQPFEGTLDEYVSLSVDQIDEVGFSLIDVATSETGFATFEYSGEIEGTLYHWYARAVEGDGRIYLVTATALESQWAEVSAPLVATVDSFRLD